MTFLLAQGIMNINGVIACDVKGMKDEDLRAYMENVEATFEPALEELYKDESVR